MAVAANAALADGEQSEPPGCTGKEITMNAQDFVNGCEHPVFFYAGNGAPAGSKIAIFEDTDLPVDLSELEGDVGAEGVFNVTNLTDGPGAHDWRFRDWNSNTIYKIQVYDDAAEWTQQREDYEASI